jgi:hypothetical protein
MRKRLPIAGAALVAAAGGSIAIATGSSAQAVPAAVPHFIPLDQVTVPIVGPNRVDGTLRVGLVLNATDAAAAADLTEQMPRLRADMLAAAVEFSRLYASGFAAVDVRQLSADMTAALKREYPGIDQVLIVEVAALQA